MRGAGPHNVEAGRERTGHGRTAGSDPARPDPAHPVVDEVRPRPPPNIERRRRTVHSPGCFSLSNVAPNHQTTHVTALENPFHRAIYLSGPTASGKSAVGVALARILHAEILAMDSMTLYRRMDLGTAKPTLEERQGIPHHLLDVLEPWEAASLADYRAWANRAVLEVEQSGKRALFVGGTALYLKALLRGLFEGPGADQALRAELEDEALREGDVALHARLAAADPVTASRLHPNDRRRVIRALEVLRLTGQSLRSFQNEHERPAEGVTVLVLERPREEIRDRIDRRVLAMFREGLVEEVRGLLEGPRPWHEVPSQGVGYREVSELLAGRLTEDEAIARTRARTRQFAKRQGTWFRGLAEVRLWPVPTDERPEKTAERLAEAIVLAREGR